ncbi:MAG: DUF6473 family protein [Pseudomonadota bacterium]
MPLLRVGRRASGTETCYYGSSRLAFRGPRRDLSGRFVALLGGSETYGRGVSRPFPDLLEGHLGLNCVNLGWPNAGVDVMYSDPMLVRIASKAALTVLQVPGAVNMTTRFYKVHPRRNDRVIAVRAPLRRLYGDVDFTQFAFTRHLLAHLRAVSPERFLQIQSEAAAVWTQVMRRLLERIEGPVVLLWFSDRAPNRHCDDPCLMNEPSLVSADMLEMIATRSCAVVACPTGTTAQPRPGLTALAERLVFGPPDRALRLLPGPQAHENAADALAPILGRHLYT